MKLVTLKLDTFFNGQWFPTDILVQESNKGVAVTFGDPRWGLLLVAEGIDFIKLKALFKVWKTEPQQQLQLADVMLSDCTLHINGSKIFLNGFCLEVFGEIFNSVKYDPFMVGNPTDPLPLIQNDTEKIDQVRVVPDETINNLKQPKELPEPIVLPSVVVRVENIESPVITAEEYKNQLDAPPFMVKQ